MQSFNYYSQAWGAYILLGLILLFVIDLKLRQLGFKLRAAILSLIATGAFTPLKLIEVDSFAPAVVASLLNAEIEGVAAIYQGLTLLLIVWGILFFTILAIRHFVVARSTANDDEQRVSRPEQVEPKLDIDK